LRWFDSLSDLLRHRFSRQRVRGSGMQSREFRLRNISVVHDQGTRSIKVVSSITIQRGFWFRQASESIGN
jgi:hypothetical protein